MKNFLIFLLVQSLITSCQTKALNKAEDAEEAGREFIRASLDGNYDRALFFLLKDSTNTNVMLLEKWKRDYNKLKEEEKINYKDANIIAFRITPVNDSTVDYVYANSFEVTDTTTLKVVKVNGEWLVDLKDIH